MGFVRDVTGETAAQEARWSAENQARKANAIAREDSAANRAWQEKIGNRQLNIVDRQMRLAEDAQRFNNQLYRPLEQSIVHEAMGDNFYDPYGGIYNTPAFNVDPSMRSTRGKRSVGFGSTLRRALDDSYASGNMPGRVWYGRGARPTQRGNRPSAPINRAARRYGVQNRIAMDQYERDMPFQNIRDINPEGQTRQDVRFARGTARNTNAQARQRARQELLNAGYAPNSERFRSAMRQFDLSGAAAETGAINTTRRDSGRYWDDKRYARATDRYNRTVNNQSLRRSEEDRAYGRDVDRFNRKLAALSPSGKAVQQATSSMAGAGSTAGGIGTQQINTQFPGMGTFNAAMGQTGDIAAANIQGMGQAVGTGLGIWAGM